MSIIGNFKSLLQQDLAKKDQEYEKLKRGVSATNDPRLGTLYGSSVDTQPSWLETNSDLSSRYWDYERMDTYPELASALDVYADDATIDDIYYHKCIWPVAKDKMVRLVLEDMMDNRLRIQDNIWAITRTLAKYGNVFGELVADKSGIRGINYLPAPTVRRVNNDRGTLVGYIQDLSMNFGQKNDYLVKCLQEKKFDLGRGVVLFEPHEVVHWKIPSKTITANYGYSMLDPARHAWKRVMLAEDSSLVNKLARGGGRYANYVDVGGRNDQDAIAYVKSVRDAFRAKTTIKGAGQLDMQANLLSPLEDFWIPSRNGQDSTRIEFLAAPDIQDTELLQYFKDMLFSGIKVPQSYLGRNDGDSREALSQKDMRFAKTEMRLQRVIATGFRFVSAVHLAILGISPLAVQYDYAMTIPSTVFALTQLELRNAQADNADRLEKWFTREFILANVFGYSQDDSVQIKTSKEEEELNDTRRNYDTQSQMIKEFPEVVNAGMMAGTDGAAMGGGMGQEEYPESVEEKRKYFERYLERKMSDRIERMRGDILAEAERRNIKNARKKTAKAIRRYESLFAGNKKDKKDYPQELKSSGEGIK